jgi:hypothetical protein
VVADGLLPGIALCPLFGRSPFPAMTTFILQFVIGYGYNIREDFQEVKRSIRIRRGDHGYGNRDEGKADDSLGGSSFSFKHW